MPGLVGVAISCKSKSVGKTLAQMISTSAYSDKYHEDTFVDEINGVAFSRLHLGIFNHGTQPVYSKDKRYQILFDGELYNNASGKTDPEFILERYECYQDNCVREIEGVFAFVIFDLHQRVLKVFNDHFGLKPIYSYCSADSFHFASEIKAILPCLEGAKKRDDNTITDFFIYGFPLGDETLFEEIKLLPAASCLIYDLNSKKFSRHRYWKLVELFTPKGLHGQKGYQDVVDCFLNSVNRRLSYLDHLGLSLSGGLDSRSILAALGRRSKGFKTYTVGLTHCRDEDLAHRMANLVGTIHAFVPVDLKYLNRYAEVANQFIYLTDGLFHPREGTEIVSLDYFRRAPFKISLRGHGGEIAKAFLAHPVMVNKDLLAARTKQDILQWIYNRGNHVTSHLKLPDLFNRSFYDKLMNHSLEYLGILLSDALEILQPGDVALYFYLDQMSRRFTVPSLDIFRTQIEIRMPFFDVAYLKQLLKLPIQSRLDGQIQREIVRQCCPELMKIPDSNTGAPLDANSWQVFMIDKMNSLLKKLSISGYRHYTEYSKWQRTYFKETMVNILFSEESRQRNIYQIGNLESIFQNHMDGKIDTSAFLATAIGIELWHRQFIDP